MRDDFAVFILSHGRANNIVTISTLRKCGYTGKIYIIIDNLDEQINIYKKKYGNSVIIFNKEEESKKSDTFDNEQDLRIVLYARNICHEMASKLGLTYFLELDDDYTTFQFRYAEGTTLKAINCKQLDKVFNAFIDFLDASGAVTVAMAQGGDYLGGINSAVWRKKLTRKAMNSFFCRTDKPFKFLGKINEDVNAYVTLGSQGKLFFTVGKVELEQGTTQKNEHGLTDVYLKYGTYVKSFYSVMCMPSAVKISTMGATDRRIHHNIQWENTVPKIISSTYKK
ncbi:MAG: hypothetical protein IKQ46_10670 [Bacteroidales bacterium]|nr:hypothetical protein [Bacteroidales bacterium]